MIKVDQTITERGKGNCMQAALSSLFHTDMDKTINIIDHIDSGWQIPFMCWIASIGYEYDGVYTAFVDMDKTKENLKDSPSVSGYLLAAVPSKNHNGVSHAVIINNNGLVVHDPHPKMGWLGVNVVESGEISYWYLFSEANNDKSSND
jgi:hypothetical protein